MKRFALTVLALLGVFLAINCLSVVVIGTTLWHLATSGLFRHQLLNELSAARASWQEAQVHEYEIDVAFTGVGLWFQCAGWPEPVTLYVKDGVVVDVEGGDLDGCESTFREVTIEAVLDRVADDLNRYDPMKETLRIDFEPHWGYVVQYSYDRHSSLIDSVGDGSSRIEVRGFRPLR